MSRSGSRSHSVVGLAVLALDIQPGSTGSEPNGLIRAGNYVYFEADDGTHPGELWPTDGTQAGTILLKDVAPGSDWGRNGLSRVAVVGSTLYFPAGGAFGDQELWKSTGTEAGTTIVN